MRTVCALSWKTPDDEERPQLLSSPIKVPLSRCTDAAHTCDLPSLCRPTRPNRRPHRQIHLHHHGKSRRRPCPALLATYPHPQGGMCRPARRGGVWQRRRRCMQALFAQITGCFRPRRVKLRCGFGLRRTLRIQSHKRQMTVLQASRARLVWALLVEGSGWDSASLRTSR